MRRRCAAMDGGPITTVAPTTTATALTSITTGLTPGEHGLIGYRMVLGGEVLNVLRWTRRRSATAAARNRRATSSRSRRSSASRAGGQPGRAGAARRSPRPTCGVGDQVGWRAPSSHRRRGRRPAARPASASSTPTTAASTRSPTSAASATYYDAELRAADRLVGDVLDGAARRARARWSPPTTARSRSATTSSHPTGDAARRSSRMQSGEGRFRWLHARRGAADDLLAAATDEPATSPGS